MAAYAPPPVPPRPYSASGHPRETSLPPPIPPLPPNFRKEEPLAAPRPQRFNPDIPADMARTLDEQLAYNGPRLATPQPPPGGPNMGINLAPGFAFPGAPPPLYSPPPMSSMGSPMIPMPQIQADDGALASSMGGLSLNGPYPPRQRAVSQFSPGLPVPNMGDGAPRVRTLSTAGPPPNYDPSSFTNPPIPQNSSQPRTSSPPRAPSLTAPLPTVSTLQAALPAVQAPNADVGSKVAWIRDVLLLVNRSTASTSNKAPTSIDPISGPAVITEPVLQRLADAAVPMLMTLAPGAPAQGQQLTAPLAEALHLRACLISAGTFPTHLPQNQRTAFREFEAAARSGFSPASWFRLGRDYESFGDATHAVGCFDRGARAGDESCLYRLGMANLLGQLGIPQDYGKALPMLQRAATLASITVPQPAYVFALILLGDSSGSTLPLNSPVPQHLITPLIPPGSTPQTEARKHLERAAYLHFTPAQYKLGHAYEFAEAPFPFDPLLSVQYYSLASQSGEPEADLALSRWFLCGSDGGGGGPGAVNEAEGFKRDENLAFVFGEKAAKKGLPAAEFAMGYYWEVGVGVPAPDVKTAIGWYELAANHGNPDAVQRLEALKKESGQALTRQEHEAITEHKLVRKRTQAKQRSEASGARVTPSVAGRGNANQVVEGIKKTEQAQHRQSYQPRHSSLGAMAQQQQLPTSSPPMTHANMPSPNPNSQDPMQRLRDRPRYSLVDPGSASGSPPPGRTGSPQRTAGRGGGRIVSGGYSPKSDNASLPPSSNPATPPATESSKPSAGGGTRYNTFAEMGVQSGRAEDKDCVIM
ncbi:uncharacterized protein FOMMEDRAFT_103780 [Fomitiporia mediterranea MF3/22]|uniref:uncharacterized protein n=1 Tax=Fomitiporia mediterranea (strain MF3/22) TaxID=694068 RepID=UPI000440741B|nr:uncharacterized protein FOMMEDRAFT_103780 [Fomitiporia mediterranea MF3/22]EJD05647.1 hypothetical protein FOMMEDRAFT_103780 [Fomitiporia mediterranea MF3/22]